MEAQIQKISQLTGPLLSESVSHFPIVRTRFWTLAYAGMHLITCSLHMQAYIRWHAVHVCICTRHTCICWHAYENMQSANAHVASAYVVVTSAYRNVTSARTSSIFEMLGVPYCHNSKDHFYVYFNSWLAFIKY